MLEIVMESDESELSLQRKAFKGDVNPRLKNKMPENGIVQLKIN